MKRHSLSIKVIASLVLTFFTFNTITQDMAFALSPVITSSGMGEVAKAETRNAMQATGGKYLAAKKGLPDINFDMPAPDSFTGEAPLMLDISPAKTDWANLPEGWEKNPMLAKTDLIEAFKYFRDNEAQIPAGSLDIKEGDYPVEEEKGALPIARIEFDNTTGKPTIVIHTKFVQAWNHVRQNDIWFTEDFEHKDGKPVQRTVSVAWGIFYRLAKHEMGDLARLTKSPKTLGHLIGLSSYDRKFDVDKMKEQMKKFMADFIGLENADDMTLEETLANKSLGRYSVINDGIWLWFLESYSFSNATRYNNDFLGRRIKWLFTDKEAVDEMKLDLEFPEEMTNHNAYERARDIALFINYHFFSREGMRVPEFKVEDKYKDEYRARAGNISKILYAAGGQGREPAAPALEVAQTNIIRDEGRGPSGYIEVNAGKLLDEIFQEPGARDLAKQALEEWLSHARTEAATEALAKRIQELDKTLAQGRIKALIDCFNGSLSASTSVPKQAEAEARQSQVRTSAPQMHYELLNTILNALITHLDFASIDKATLDTGIAGEIRGRLELPLRRLNELYRRSEGRLPIATIRGEQSDARSLDLYLKESADNAIQTHAPNVFQIPGTPYVILVKRHNRETTKADIFGTDRRALREQIKFITVINYLTQERKHNLFTKYLGLVDIQYYNVLRDVRKEYLKNEGGGFNDQIILDGDKNQFDKFKTRLAAALQRQDDISKDAKVVILRLQEKIESFIDINDLMIELLTIALDRGTISRETAKILLYLQQIGVGVVSEEIARDVKLNTKYVSLGGDAYYGFQFNPNRAKRGGVFKAGVIGRAVETILSPSFIQDFLPLQRGLTVRTAGGNIFYELANPYPHQPGSVNAVLQRLEPQNANLEDLEARLKILRENTPPGEASRYRDFINPPFAGHTIDQLHYQGFLMTTNLERTLAQKGALKILYTDTNGIDVFSINNDFFEGKAQFPLRSSFVIKGRDPFAVANAVINILKEANANSTLPITLDSKFTYNLLIADDGDEYRVYAMIKKIVHDPFDYTGVSTREPDLIIFTNEPKFQEDVKGMKARMNNIWREAQDYQPELSRAWREMKDKGMNDDDIKKAMEGQFRDKLVKGKYDAEIKKGIDSGIILYQGRPAGVEMTDLAIYGNPGQRAIYEKVMEFPELQRYVIDEIFKHCYYPEFGALVAKLVNNQAGLPNITSMPVQSAPIAFKPAPAPFSLEDLIAEIRVSYGPHLATQLENKLKGFGIRDIDQLREEILLFKHRGIGEESIEAIREILTRHGLALKGDEPSVPNGTVASTAPAAAVINPNWLAIEEKISEELSRRDSFIANLQTAHNQKIAGLHRILPGEGNAKKRNELIARLNRETEEQVARIESESRQKIEELKRRQQLFTTLVTPTAPEGETQTPAASDIELNSKAIKEGPWSQFVYHVGPSGEILGIEPSKIPSQQEDRLPGQQVLGEEYAFDLRLGAQSDTGWIKRLHELQERVRSVVSNGAKLYVPDIESFHIALAGRYPEKKLGPLNAELIARTIDNLRGLIKRSGMGRFTVVVSGVKITDNGTIILKLKENPLLGQLRQLVFETMKSSGWNESELRVLQTGGKPSSGGIITLARIIPNLQGNDVFMSKNELHALNAEVSRINEQLQANPVAIDFDTISFIHPTRAFLSEGWDKEVRLDLAVPAPVVGKNQGNVPGGSMPVEYLIKALQGTEGVHITVKELADAVNRGLQDERISRGAVRKVFKADGVSQFNQELNALRAHAIAEKASILLNEGKFPRGTRHAILGYLKDEALVNSYLGWIGFTPHDLKIIYLTFGIAGGKPQERDEISRKVRVTEERLKYIENRILHRLELHYKPLRGYDEGLQQAAGIIIGYYARKAGLTFYVTEADKNVAKISISNGQDYIFHFLIRKDGTSYEGEILDAGEHSVERTTVRNDDSSAVAKALLSKAKELGQPQPAVIQSAATPSVRPAEDYIKLIRYVFTVLGRRIRRDREETAFLAVNNALNLIGNACGFDDKKRQAEEYLRAISQIEIAIGHLRSSVLVSELKQAKKLILSQENEHFARMRGTLDYVRSNLRDMSRLIPQGVNKKVVINIVAVWKYNDMSEPAKALAIQELGYLGISKDGAQRILDIFMQGTVPASMEGVPSKGNARLEKIKEPLTPEEVSAWTNDQIAAELGQILEIIKESRGKRRIPKGLKVYDQPLTIDDIDALAKNHNYNSYQRRLAIRLIVNFYRISANRYTSIKVPSVRPAIRPARAMKTGGVAVSSLGMPAIGRLVDPGNFIQQGVQGKQADSYRAKIRPSIPLDQTLAFLEKSGGVTAETSLRGADLGSSMDLGRGAGMKPGLKELVTPREAKNLADIAQTIVIPSKFKARIQITALTPEEKQRYGNDSIIYISDLHGCPESRPGIYGEPIKLVDGKAPRKQADMVGYILWNLYGVHGVKVVFDVYYPGKENDKSYGIIATKAGGMGTSGATNTLLHQLGSILSGANLTRSECASEAIDDENTVASGYTGGQEGYVATAAEPGDNTRAVDLVWIGGVLDANGKPKYHPHAALSIPMLMTPEDVAFVEDHAVILQIGARFERNSETGGIEKVAHRSASCINTGWMHSAETARDAAGKDIPVDLVGAKYHKQKIEFVRDMRTGLIRRDITLLNRGNMGHVGARNGLSLREAQIITAGDQALNITPQRERLNDYSISDKIGLATYGLSDDQRKGIEAATLPILEKEKRKEQITTADIATLNDLVIENLKRLLANNISLYSDYSKKLYAAIEEEIQQDKDLSMSAFNTGAGGDGGIIMLWSSKGVKHIEDFLRRRLGIERFNPEEAVAVTTRTGGTLAGWMPFEIGEIGTFIKFGKISLADAAAAGFALPQASPIVEYDETNAEYTTVSSLPSMSAAPAPTAPLSTEEVLAQLRASGHDIYPEIRAMLQRAAAKYNVTLQGGDFTVVDKIRLQEIGRSTGVELLTLLGVKDRGLADAFYTELVGMQVQAMAIEDKKGEPAVTAITTEQLVPVSKESAVIALPPQLNDIMRRTIKGGAEQMVTAVMSDDKITTALMQTQAWRNKNDLRTTLTDVAFGTPNDATIKAARALTKMVAAHSPSSPIALVVSNALMERRMDAPKFMELADELLRTADAPLAENLENLLKGNIDMQFKAFQWLMDRMLQEAEAAVRSRAEKDKEDLTKHLLIARIILKQIDTIISKTDEEKWLTLRIHMFMKFAERISAEGRSETKPFMALLLWLYPEVSKDLFLAVDTNFIAVAKLYENKKAESVLNQYGGYEIFCQAMETLLSYACLAWPDDFFEYLKSHYIYASPTVKAYYLCSMKFAIISKAEQNGSMRAVDTGRAEFILSNTIDLCSEPSLLVQKKCAEIMRDMPDLFVEYLSRDGIYTKLDVTRRSFLIDQLVMLAGAGKITGGRTKVLAFVMHEINAKNNIEVQKKILSSPYFDEDTLAALTPGQAKALRAAVITGYHEFSENNLIDKNCRRIMAKFGMASVEECYEYFTQHVNLDYAMAIGVLKLGAYVASGFKAENPGDAARVEKMIDRISALAGKAVAEKLKAIEEYNALLVRISQLHKELSSLSDHVKTTTEVVNEVNEKAGKLVEEQNRQTQLLMRLRVTYIRQLEAMKGGMRYSKMLEEVLAGKLNIVRLAASLIRIIKRFLSWHRPQPKITLAELEKLDTPDKMTEFFRKEAEKDKTGAVKPEDKTVRQLKKDLAAVEAGIADITGGIAGIYGLINEATRRLSEIEPELKEAEKEQVAVAEEFVKTKREFEQKTKELANAEGEGREKAHVNINTTSSKSSDMHTVLGLFMEGPSIRLDKAAELVNGLKKIKDEQPILLLLSLACNPRFADVASPEEAKSILAAHMSDQAERGIYHAELINEITRLTELSGAVSILPQTKEDTILKAVIAMLRQKRYQPDKTAEAARIAAHLNKVRTETEIICAKAIQEVREVAGAAGDNLERAMELFLKMKLGQNTIAIDRLMTIFMIVSESKGCHVAISTIFFMLSYEGAKYFIQPEKEEIKKPKNFGEAVEIRYRRYYFAAEKLRQEIFSANQETLKAEEGFGWDSATNDRALYYLSAIHNLSQASVEVRHEAERSQWLFIWYPWLGQKNPFKISTGFGEKEKKLSLSNSAVLASVEAYINSASAVTMEDIDSTINNHATAIVVSLSYKFAKKMNQVSESFTTDMIGQILPILRKMEEIISPDVMTQEDDGQYVYVLVAIREAIKTLSEHLAPAKEAAQKVLPTNLKIPFRLEGSGQRPLLPPKEARSGYAREWELGKPAQGAKLVIEEAQRYIRAAQSAGKAEIEVVVNEITHNWSITKALKKAETGQILIKEGKAHFLGGGVMKKTAAPALAATPAVAPVVDERARTKGYVRTNLNMLAEFKALDTHIQDQVVDILTIRRLGLIAEGRAISGLTGLGLSEELAQEFLKTLKTGTVPASFGSATKGKEQEVSALIGRINKWREDSEGAFTALNVLKGLKTINEIRSIVEDNSLGMITLQLNAVAALTELRAVDALRSIVANEKANWNLRIRAINALEELSAAEALVSLTPVFGSIVRQEKNEYLFSAALQALVYINAAETLQSLKPTLISRVKSDEEKPFLRISALAMLGNIGAIKELCALEPKLRSITEGGQSDYYLREQARASLKIVAAAVEDLAKTLETSLGDIMRQPEFENSEEKIAHSKNVISNFRAFIGRNWGGFYEELKKVKKPSQEEYMSLMEEALAMYDSLSPEGKIQLHLAVIFHDMGSKTGEKDSALRRVTEAKYVKELLIAKGCPETIAEGVYRIKELYGITEDIGFSFLPREARGLPEHLVKQLILMSCINIIDTKNGNQFTREVFSGEREMMSPENINRLSNNANFFEYRFRNILTPRFIVINGFLPSMSDEKFARLNSVPAIDMIKKEWGSRIVISDFGFWRRLADSDFDKFLKYVEEAALQSQKIATATGADRIEIKIYNDMIKAQAPEPVAPAAPAQAVSTVTLPPNLRSLVGAGAFLAMFTKDNMLSVYSLKTKEYIVEGEHAPGGFQLTGTHVAWRDSDNRLYVHDFKTKTIEHIVNVYEDRMPGGFRLTDAYLGWRDSYGNLYVRDLRTKRDIVKGEYAPGGFQLTDTHIAWRDSAGKLYLRDLSTKEYVAQGEDASGNFKLTATRVGWRDSNYRLYVRDLTTKKDIIRGEYTPGGFKLTDALELTDTHVSWQDSAGKLYLRDLSTGGYILQGEHTSGGFQLTDTHVAWRDPDSRLYVRNLRTKEYVVQGEDNSSQNLQLTDTHVAWQDSNGKPYLRDLRTKEDIKGLICAPDLKKTNLPFTFVETPNGVGISTAPSVRPTGSTEKKAASTTPAPTANDHIKQLLDFIPEKRVPGGGPFEYSESEIPRLSAKAKVEIKDLVEAFEWTIKLMLDKGPASQAELDEFIQKTVGVTNIYQAANLIHDSKIEIFLPQGRHLTGAVEKALERINQSSKAEAVKYHYYASPERLVKFLRDNPCTPGVKRVIISEESFAEELGGKIANNVLLFRNVRLINIEMPSDYSRMTINDRSVCQGRMLMIAILARLYEKDNNSIKYLLTILLQNYIETGEIGNFINNLPESENEKTKTGDLSAEDLKEIVSRINFFLGKTVSLIKQKVEELMMMKELWRYA